MSLRKFIFIVAPLMLGLGLQSCTSKSSKEKESGDLIEITHSSGDDYSYEIGEDRKFYAPYPFNQGVLQAKDGVVYDVVILSKRIDKGMKVGVELFAKMTLVDMKGKESDVLIARPTNKSYELSPIMDFYDFSIEQFYLKQMVQYWYSNRYGLNGTIVKGWEPITLDSYN